jgi:hypothetical protein
MLEGLVEADGVLLRGNRRRGQEIDGGKKNGVGDGMREFHVWLAEATLYAGAPYQANRNRLEFDVQEQIDHEAHELDVVLYELVLLDVELPVPDILAVIDVEERQAQLRFQTEDFEIVGCR